MLNGVCISCSRYTRHSLLARSFWSDTLPVCTTQAYDDPLAFLHMAVEGQVSFRALLYVPGSLPWELSRNMFGKLLQPLRISETGQRKQSQNVIL